MDGGGGGEGERERVKPSSHCGEEAREGGHSKSHIKSWDKNSVMSCCCLTCELEM